jgi:hypothetical protein
MRSLNQAWNGPDLNYLMVLSMYADYQNNMLMVAIDRLIIKEDRQ